MLRGKDRPVPGPTYMSETQKVEYLRSLRTSTAGRPSGSRPPPPPKFPSTRPSIETDGQDEHARTSDERPTLLSSTSVPNVLPSELIHAGDYTKTTAPPRFAGQPLARPPSSNEPSEAAAQRHSHTNIPYVERGTRWMEKQEARSLRMALQDMDQTGGEEEEEMRIYSAAQDEAAELVWKHRNPDAPCAQPGAPYRNPDSVRRDYHSHLRKGSYQRSQHGQDDSGATGPERKISGGSHEDTKESSITAIKRRSMDVLRKVSPPSSAQVVVEKRRTPSGKSYGGLAEAVASDIAKAHRRSSSGSHRMLSGEKKTKMFMHPNDQIWEDPQEREQPSQQLQLATEPPPKSNPTPTQQPTHVRKNPFARVRLQADKLERSRSEPIVSHTPIHHSVEIQKNTPSQSRRAWYTSNPALPPTPPPPSDQTADEVAPKTTPTKELGSKEVRDDDIRAATSKRRSDYSPKLPRPTMVSDRPGRPIVSFQDWKQKEIVLEEGGHQAAPFARTYPGTDIERDPSKTRQPTRSPKSFLPSQDSDSKSKTMVIPQINVEEEKVLSKPPVPQIILPNEPSIPSIVLPSDGPDFALPPNAQSAPATPIIYAEPPEINVAPPEVNVHYSEEPSPRSMPFAQPWPTASTAAASRRPVPTHAATSPLPHSHSKPHYTPSTRQQSGTLCGHCALPIAGRILSAGGERFHPACFVCHQCHTNLELVAFYAEPDSSRTARLARIQARQSGAPISIDDLYRQEAEDGNGEQRFYCHLDFHELFSPRCKSCKTPIEGEVIVACGAEWHAGHFFCAQCGDPFDKTTPFVEKDGYAWCVGCHTNRYSSKCRKCRKPITDTVVKALGYEWHEGCFVCAECNGGFADGKYFLRGASQDPVCVGCEQRRLKA